MKVTLIIEYEINKYALVHETYRGILDKSFHLKSGCILGHGHKPLILEEKSQEPQLEDN
jgi:predicted solute-binding protein